MLFSKNDHRSTGKHISLHLIVMMLLCRCVASSRALAQLTSAPSNSAAAPPSAISGRVVNAISGQPIPRVLVQLGTYAMLSDGEGKFSFTEPGLAFSSLTAQKPGYSLEPEQIVGGSVAGISTQDPKNIQVVLWPEAVLTGTVTSPDGEPLPHVQIMARHVTVNETGLRQQFAGQAQTDSTGSWRIPVSAGRYSLEIPYASHMPGRSEALLPYSYPPGAADGTRDLVTVRSGQELQFQLQPSLGVTHGVDLPFDSPGTAPGANERPPRVTAISPGGQAFQASAGRPAAPGRLHLELPQGSYRLEGIILEADGMLFGDSSVTVPDHDIAAPVMHLSAIVSTPLEMIVESSSASQTASSGSAPQVNAMSFNLALQPLQSDTQSPLQFGIRPRFEKDGTPRFQAPPGTYKLSGNPSGGWYVRSATYGGTDLLQNTFTISRSAGSTPIRMVVSNGTGSLKGSTRSAGTPAQAWLYLLASGPSVSPLIVRRSNVDGGFNISNLPPGSYRVLALPYHLSLDFADASATARYASFMGSATVVANNTATLDVDTIPAKEVQP